MSIRFQRFSRMAMLGGLLSLLSACSILPEPEQLRIFLLPSSTSTQAATGPQSKQALRIVTPQASRILSTSRIAVVPQGNEISAYRGARWSDAAPVLLRDRLIETFQQDGRLPSVSNEDDSLPADLALHSDLRAFQSVYVDGAPQVLIRLDARLVSQHNHQTLASRRFEIRQPSTAPGVESVVEAFGQASDRLSRELLDWTLEQARQQPAPR